jgi:hypothetical protein
MVNKRVLHSILWTSPLREVFQVSPAYEGCGNEISICLRDIQNILNDSKLAFAQNEQQLDLLCRYCAANTTDSFSLPS